MTGESTVRTMQRALLRRPWLTRILVIAGLLLFWEAASRWWIDPMFLSPPSDVLLALGSVFETKGVPGALRITFWELAVAFAMSVAVGLVAGLAVGLSRFSHRIDVSAVIVTDVLFKHVVLVCGQGTPSDADTTRSWREPKEELRFPAELFQVCD